MEPGTQDGGSGGKVHCAILFVKESGELEKKEARAEQFIKSTKSRNYEFSPRSG